jgi:tetratricopeptide (TPR) repeat protein
LKHARTAQSIEPLSLRIGVEHAWLLYANRLFEAAAEQCWKVLALESRVWMAQLVLGLAYRELGMSGEAIAEAHNAVICSGRNPLALAALGCLSNGDSAEILIELQELSQIRYVNPLSFALVYAGMKQPEAALQWTRRAFTEQDIHLHWLKQSPLLEPFLEPITSHKRE